MERETKGRPILGSLAIGLTLGCLALAFGLFLFVSLTATVSGRASLPNGITASIDGPFDSSEVAGITTIDAGGHTFTFSPTTISIDGVVIGPLNATVTDVQITASRGSASLRINGHEVSIPK